MMTEEEARKKWCPYRKGSFNADTLCIASDCMAWDWLGYITDGKLYPDGMKAVNNERVGDCMLKRGQP